MAGHCRSCWEKCLPAITDSGCPRPCRIAGSSPGWPAAIWMRPVPYGVTCWPVSTPPPWSARQTGGSGQSKRYLVRRIRADHAGPWRAGAYVSHHRQHGAAGRLRAAVDVADRRADVAFGAVVSGRPDEVVGADSMVGLLINTVPVRATITSTTTTTDLLDQLQKFATRHWSTSTWGSTRSTASPVSNDLFDTVFVYENYPTDAAKLSGADGLAITEITNRDYYHYPLTSRRYRADELDLHVQYPCGSVRRDRHRHADQAIQTGCWWP